MENSKATCDLAFEAEEYVNSVMSTQHISAILRTPLPSGRKRSRSTSDVSETELKKLKSDYDTRDTLKAKKSILQSPKSNGMEPAKPGSSRAERDSGDSSTETEQIGSKDLFISQCNEKSSERTNKRKGKKKGRPTLIETDTEEAVYRTDVNVKEDEDVKCLLRKMSDNIQSMYESLNKKIDMIETRIDQSEKKLTDKICDKVTKIIDKRVSSETSKIRKEVDEKLSALRLDLNTEINQLSDRLYERGRDIQQHRGEDDVRLRVAIRNLPETVNENVCDKVNNLIRDGLKVREVNVESATRKSSRDAAPGLVIATFQSREDKEKVMRVKQSLKNSRQYGRVYINHDQTKEERILAQNMRTLVEGVKRGQNLRVQGSRIVADNGYETRRDADSRRHGSMPSGVTSERAEGNSDTYDRLDRRDSGAPVGERRSRDTYSARAGQNDSQRGRQNDRKQQMGADRRYGRQMGGQNYRDSRRGRNSDTSRPERYNRN